MSFFFLLIYCYLFIEKKKGMKFLLDNNKMGKMECLICRLVVVLMVNMVHCFTLSQAEAEALSNFVRRMWQGGDFDNCK